MFFILLSQIDSGKTLPEIQVCIQRLEKITAQEDETVDDASLVRPFFQGQSQVQKYLSEQVFRNFLLSDQYRRCVFYLFIFFLPFFSLICSVTLQ